MSELSRIGVAIDSDLLKKFDNLIAARGYTNRSEAFRDLIRDELVEKVRYHLSHEEERAQIARAGQARCVPAYSYESRVKAILSYYDKNTRTKAKSAVA